MALSDKQTTKPSVLDEPVTLRMAILIAATWVALDWICGFVKLAWRLKHG